MAETRWNRAHAWLIGAMVINLAGVISGFVSNRIGEPTWLEAVGWSCLAAAFACLIVFVIEWRRYRAAEKARAERPSE